MGTSGAYNVLEEVGRNDYLTVYRGYDFVAQRHVAIMELHGQFAADRAELDSLWEEARQSIGHRNKHLTEVYDVDEARRWIVTQWAEDSLASRLQQGPLSSDDVHVVLHHALQGLRDLHDGGRLHGDVRPGNLLVDETGQLRLSYSPGLTIAGDVPRRATAAKYTAPELINPQFGEVTPQIDLYSLGFAAIELLKGSAFDSMFKGIGSPASNRDEAWLLWHGSLSDRLEPTVRLVPGVPADLAQVIDRLVKKPTAERYASADAALRDLKRPPRTILAVGGAPQANTVPASLPRGKAAVARAHIATSQGSHRLSLKDRINGALRRPAVLYPLCLIIVLSVPLLAIFLQRDSTETADPDLGEVTVAGSSEGSNEPIVGAVASPDQTEPRPPGDRMAAIRFYNEGKQYLRVGNHEQAEQFFSQAIELAPDFAEALAARGWARLASQDPQAESDFAEALVRDGQLRWAQHGLAVVQAGAGDREAAFDHLRGAIQLDPSLVALLQTLARRASDEGNFAEAIRLMSLALECGGKAEAALYRDRGLALLALQVDSEAIADFERALDLDARDAASHHGLGIGLLRRGDLNDAVDSLTRAIELDAHQTQPYVDRALANMELGEYQLAAADLTRALELGESRSPTLRRRGEAWLAQGENQQALGDFDNALAADAADALAHAGRAEALFRLGQGDAALEACQEALRYDSGLVRMYLIRGLQHERSGRYDDAVADLSVAMHREDLPRPDWIAAAYARGNSFLRLGLNEPAIRDFDAVLRVASRHEQALAKRGFAYANLRRYGLAIADYDRLIAQRPSGGLDSAYNNRGVSRMQLRRYGEALADFESAIHLNSGFASAYYNRHLVHRALGNDRQADADLDRAVALDSSLRP